MPRRRYTSLSVLCFALCAVTCVLWIRSHYFCDTYEMQTDGCFICSNTGAISIGALHWPFQMMQMSAEPLGYERTSASKESYAGDPGTRHDWRFMGFQWHVSNGGTSTGVSNGSGRVTYTIWQGRLERRYPILVCGGDPRNSSASLASITIEWRPSSRRLLPRVRLRSSRTPSRCPECGRATKSSMAM